ncbi:HAMP domain-containing protein [candidate division KSB1 bacterium]|nr:HAMP domain-containing protein [candidate division KSB1 bacterium]
MNFILSRIQNKIIAAFLIVLLIPLLSYIYIYFSTSRTVTDIVINYELDELVLSLRTLRHHLQNIMNDTKYMSESRDMIRFLSEKQSGSDSEIENALSLIADNSSSYAINKNMYQHISYIDESGDEIFRLNNDGSRMTFSSAEKLQNQSRRAFFKETMKMQAGECYVSNIHLYKEKGKIFKPYQPVINYATPVFYPNGSRAGIILVTANANIFLEGLVSTKHGKPGKICLVDKDGYFLINPDSTKLWGRDVGTNTNLGDTFRPKYVEEILAQKDGHTFTNQNLVCHALFIPPGNTEIYWKLLNIIEIDELTDPVTSLRNIFVLAFIVGIFISIAIAVYLARGISGPVHHLTQVANKISHGELDVEVKTKSRDEIGQLADSINRMRASLEAAIIRLRKNR